MDAQGATDEGFVDVLEALEADLSEFDPRPGLHFICDIDGVRGIVGGGFGPVHGRQGIAIFLQRRKQVQPRIQHHPRHGGIAVPQADGGAILCRDIAFQHDSADVIERPRRHHDIHRSGRVRRQRIQARRQLRIVRRHARHGDGDAVLVVAEAVHRGLQPRNIRPHPRHQSERLDRAAILQGNELGTGAQGRIHLARTGAGHLHGIALRFGGACDACSQDESQQRYGTKDSLRGFHADMGIDGADRQSAICRTIAARIWWRPRRNPRNPRSKCSSVRGLFASYASHDGIVRSGMR